MGSCEVVFGEPTVEQHGVVGHVAEAQKLIFSPIPSSGRAIEAFVHRVVFGRFHA